MGRTYQKTTVGPFAGCTFYPQQRKDNECLYIVNLSSNGDLLDKRKGYDRYGAAVTTTLNPVNGLFQYKLPLGDAAGTRMILAGADDTTDGSAGGKLYKYASGSWTQLNSSLSWETNANARYLFVNINGRCYLCNGYCHLMKYYPGDATAMEMIEPVDVYEASGAHISWLDLPIPRMLGTFHDRIIIGNFNPGSGPYSTSDGSWASIGIKGPRTVYLSEVLSDFSNQVAFQVKEEYTFPTDDEQCVIAQLEYRDQNIFFLEDSTWQLTGDTGENFRGIPIDSSIGCVAPLSVVMTPIGPFWLAKDGVKRYNGQEIVDVSAKIKGIFTQQDDAVVLSPLFADMGKAAQASARYHPITKEYQIFLPLSGCDNNELLCAYNIETKAWRFGGKGTFYDTDTSLFTTDEKGYYGTIFITAEDDTGRYVGMHGDDNGFVNKDSQSCKDAYIEFLSDGSSAVKTVIALKNTASTPQEKWEYTYLATAASADDMFNGATLEILDDRTAVQKAAGTWPEGTNTAGTKRKITDCAVAATKFNITLDSALDYTVLNGCSFAIYWPIRDRIIIPLYDKEMATMKKLHSFLLRLRGTMENEIKILYKGDPGLWRVDQSIVALDPGAANVVRLESDGVAGVDTAVNCWGNNLVGRRFMLCIEEYSCAPFGFSGMVVEHSVLGSK